jgi:exopolysaccharide biosynthesis polyprenyl glycosylphosphotransferase
MAVWGNQPEQVYPRTEIKLPHAHKEVLPARPMTNTQQLVKRLFDVTFALLVVVVMSPVMLLIALLIKLDSPGPVLFRQSRIGQYGRIFTIYKFRSMFTDADEIVPHERAGFYVKRPDDPRVTHVGRWLRRTSLDELPQFLNVLRGDMSVVGPRPEVLWIAESYEPWQKERLLVPQGITGWWQVTGRALNPLHENTHYDIFYVQNFSLRFDLYILLCTLRTVLTGKGAF